MRTAISLGLVAVLLVSPLDLWAATEIRRPTAEANPNTGGDNAFSNPSNGRDGSETTFARGPAFAEAQCSEFDPNPQSDSEATSIRYHTWQTTAESYSELALKVRSAVSVSILQTGGAGATASVTLEYTLNGGTGWSTIYSVSADRALQTDTIALSGGQDLTQVQVRYRATADADCTGNTNDLGRVSITLDSYDNRTEGTFGEGQKLIIASARRK